MTFNICIMKNPAWEWTEENPVDNWDETQGDHHLGLDFDGNDFNELRNFLDIKLPPTKRLDGESYDDHENRIKNEYLNALGNMRFCTLYLLRLAC